MAGSLECPSTGRDCNFYHYCAGVKEMIDDEIHPESLTGELHQMVPEEIRGAFTEEYCSEVKIEQLTKARDESRDSSVVIMSALMVENIIDAREAFRNPVVPTSL